MFVPQPDDSYDDAESDSGFGQEFDQASSIGTSVASSQITSTASSKKPKTQIPFEIAIRVRIWVTISGIDHLLTELFSFRNVSKMIIYCQ